MYRSKSTGIEGGKPVLGDVARIHGGITPTADADDEIPIVPSYTS